MSGYTALVTGGRIKIGFETSLKLLRSGCKAIVTSRFPKDTYRRYSQMPDFMDWHSNLVVYAVDFAKLNELAAFISYLMDSLTSLEIIINNAAQTIQKPREYYKHLAEIESAALGDKNAFLGSSSYFQNDNHRPQTSLDLAALRSIDLAFPPNIYDEFDQQVDNRKVNSWVTKLQNVSIQELLEVLLINVVAPFMINSKLKPLLERSATSSRYIINVSAMEGKFNRKKSIYHPHTNLAKAALNMMTRTSAEDYARSKIFMNSVDTGWITNENPSHIADKMAEKKLFPPLDVIDGAARICDPIFTGIRTGVNESGKFLKDYKPTSW
ncbi:MAG: SDR family NAD(P)-dependent oxidoreductase [Bacteroidetes bacterium]|nr:SDR family NAD(P)-dependent oxidoreductase [Bacteroidota bacterium]